MGMRRSPAALSYLRIGIGIGLAPSLGFAAVASAEAPPSDERHFDVAAYDVDGNTVLSQIEIEEAIYPFLGENKTAADVDDARAALERAYQSRGFQTVQVEIPQQDAKDKIVRLHVVEGRVEELRVVGARYYLPSDIKALAPSLGEGKVPNIPEVQKDIVALNQLPDRKVTPTLRAGREPGTLDVDLQVEDQLPLHGSLEINNRKSQNTTDLRTIATVSYDNLWQLGHSLSLSYQVAPENTKDAEVYSATYLARVPGRPWSFQLNAIKTNSDVSTVGATDVIGNGDIVGLRGILNLAGTPTFSHSLSGGIDYKHFLENVSQGGSGGVETPVTYYPFTITYTGSQQESTALDYGTLAAVFAHPGFGSSTPQFDNKRFQAKPQFAYLRGTASRTQNLPLGSNALVEVEGQLATQALISNEQFSAGGASSVRGYDEAQALGDYGVRGTVELRSPSFAEHLDSAVDDLHVLVFAEGAGLWLHQPLPGQQISTTLASTGFGLRLRLLNHLNGAFDIAFPLLAVGDVVAGEPRFNFRVSSEY
jgi:hemolysin activation/secretion protein